MRLRPGIAAATAALATLTLVAAPAPAQDADKSDVDTLLQQIADTDKLRVLIPLHLKSGQIDQIQAVLRKAQDDRDRTMSEAEAAGVRALSAEVKSVHQKALSGEAIPEAFAQKVKAFETSMADKLKRANEVALTYAARGIRRALTPDQVRVATQHAKKATTVDGKPTMEGTDEQYFNLFVREAFLAYPRIVPLLADMKKGLTGSSSGP